MIVYHVSGHYALVNSAALAHRGIGENAANPPGGEFVRDGEGRLTGLCLDAATSRILPVAVDVGSHGPNFHTEADLADLVGLLDQAGRAYQAAGLTTVCDPQVTSRELRAYRAALAEDVLRVRVACMPLSHGLADFRALGLRRPVRLGSAADQRDEVLRRWLADRRHRGVRRAVRRARRVPGQPVLVTR